MTTEVQSSDARELAGQYGVVFAVDLRADGSATVGIETENGDVTALVFYNEAGELGIEF